MKHDHSIGHASHVNNPVGTHIVPHPDFLNPFANRWHRLEVIRLFPTLHLIKLIARILPGILRKISQAFERVTEKSNWLYQIDYTYMDIFYKARADDISALSIGWPIRPARAPSAWGQAVVVKPINRRHTLRPPYSRPPNNCRIAPSTNSVFVTR